jgi:3'-phosphoadenosine 5'-phosphosulfate sulfotransferase (PAPS reductase)/FAD synthetase
MDKVDKAIERLQAGAEMSMYYYHQPLMITYSGGKDSEVLVDLAKKAKIPMEIANSHTTADAPDTVYHIREQFAKWEAEGYKCEIHKPMYKGKPTSMWQLIPIKMIPPTRLARYCCDVLKENTGTNRMIATGIRWAESNSRKNRGIFEKIDKSASKRISLMNDNDERRVLFESCIVKGTRTTNPIIDWSDDEIWDYANAQKLCMNPLYGRGWKRVGCIGCPLGGSKSMEREFADFPKYRENYVRAFEKMIDVRKRLGKQKGYSAWGNTGEDVFHWWMEDGVLPGQMEIEDLEEENDD